MLTAIESRPTLPPVAPIAGRKCSNAEPGTFNHECGKPAAHAVTYWAEAWCSYPADWFTAYYCPRCFTHGTEARTNRAKAARIISNDVA